MGIKLSHLVYQPFYMYFYELRHCHCARKNKTDFNAESVAELHCFITYRTPSVAFSSDLIICFLKHWLFVIFYFCRSLTECSSISTYSFLKLLFKQWTYENDFAVEGTCSQNIRREFGCVTKL